jgi:hypothetical protein
MKKEEQQAVHGNPAKPNVFSEFSSSVGIVFFFIDFSC